MAIDDPKWRTRQLPELRNSERVQFGRARPLLRIIRKRFDRGNEIIKQRVCAIVAFGPTLRTAATPNSG